VIPAIIVGTFQIASFVTVTYSTLTIRRQIMKNHMQHVNTSIMMLHMIVFFFYIFSGIGFYIALVNYAQQLRTDKNYKASRKALIMETLCIGCSFVAQICQLYILR
jgi:xanthine/uracil/vitamin C permease (AzgA family)